ncbi:MAG: outer membrane beta-barrel protein [Alphaproteobacteria bacterium]|nr:outer membrane beta-barrel protein [Alphaproteobacteria bacterium]
MKKGLFLVVMTVAGICSAQAADMATYRYSKAIPAAIYDWTGLYIGANGGYSTMGSGYSGGTFGGQIGYRWQRANWVFGVEGQGDWADFGGKTSSVSVGVWPFAKVSTSSSNKVTSTIGMFTGQLGYATSNVLLYVKGGVAAVDNTADWNSNTAVRVLFVSAKTSASNSNSNTAWGGVLGAGLEYGFAQNWSVGAEYNRIFVDNDSYHRDVDMGLLRLNYRFGGSPLARF